MLNDLRYGFRMLRKSPGFTTVAVLTLALGIGANTAIFSVVDAVLLRPLPYKNPGRLVRIWETHYEGAMQGDRITVSPVNFLNWSQDFKIFEQVAASVGQTLTLTGMEPPEQLGGERVSQDFFRALGVHPVLGRDFLAEEMQPGHDHVALLSDAFWQRRFAGNPQVVGQWLTLDNKSYQVIGILPPGFRPPDQFDFGATADFLTPLTFTADIATNRGEHFLQVVARLKPGISLKEAQVKLATMARQLQQEFPDSNRGWEVRLVPLHQDLVRDYKPALLVLLAAVGFVLLIACANVANLLLAQATQQEKEVAIRAALGASRFRLIRERLTQAIELGTLGGALGILVSFWATDLLMALAPPEVSRLYESKVDISVLVFSVLLSLMTGLIFGLGPALLISRPNLSESLKEGGRSLTGGSARSRLRSSLVICEVALSLVLLTGAGLLIRSFWAIKSIEPGFRAGNVLAMNIEPPLSRYVEPPQRVAYFDRVLERVVSLPGVSSAALASHLPLTGSAGGDFSVEGRQASEFKDLMDAEFRSTSPDYFQTMGIPLLQGRHFTWQDMEKAPPVAVINQIMARRFWPNGDVIGKRIKRGGMGGDTPWLTIVGIIGDVKHRGLTQESFNEVYVPYHQPAWASSNSLYFPFPRELVVRTSLDPAGLVPALRKEIWAVDKDQPISNVRTLEQALYESVSRQRFNMLLLSLFGMVGLVLAMVGIFGVLSYTVTQRTPEIGIRMALGAEPLNVLKLVVQHGMMLTLIGVGVGLAASCVLTRLLSSLLFGITSTDPTTFAGVSLLLVGVALLACYIPARRATKVDPMAALRYE